MQLSGEAWQQNKINTLFNFFLHYNNNMLRIVKINPV